MGASEAELQEVMAVAMTVGATKIQLLQEKSLAALGEPPAGASDCKT